MIKNGGKGNSTKTGTEFEKVLSIVDFFKKQKNYKLIKNNNFSGKGEKSSAYNLFYKEKKIGLILNQNTIYKFLEREFNIHWKDIISKKMLPDNSLFLIETKQFFVFEIKNQNVAGSVDEKLQTCDFKKKQWEKLMEKIKFSIHYIYLLSPWFQKNEYEDTRKYIKSVGCDFSYSNLSLKSLGLPE